MSIAERLHSIAGRPVRWATLLVLIAVLYLMPQIYGADIVSFSRYNEVIAFMIMAVGLNLAMGYAGQLLIGITAAFVVAGYAGALVAEHYPHQAWLLVLLVVGAISGAVTGIVIGLPSLRIGGFYLGLVSLFVALALPVVATNWSFLGGDIGISLFVVDGFSPRLTGESLYLVVLSIALLTVLFCWAVVNSRVGRRFSMVSVSDQLATSVGIGTYTTKLLACAVAAGIAGVGGGVFIYTQQYIAPQSITANLAILLLAAIVIGGEGTIWGPVIGGVIVLGLNTFFTAFKEWNGVAFGLLLLAFAVLLPDGLVARMKSLEGRYLVSRGDDDRIAQSLTVSTVSGESQARLGGPPAGSETLRIRGVSKAFGGVLALNDVDLELGRGQIHGLIGSNGSGKTTLLNLVSGFYPLDGGEISIGDARLDGKRPEDIARAGVTRTFQSPKLMLRQTVLNNVVAAAESKVRCWGVESVLRLPRGVRRDREARNQAMTSLDALGLGQFAHTSAAALPHGLRRLVEIARATAMRPHFMLVDEPAAGLSPAESTVLVRALRQVADAGVGVLLIEHNVPLVLDIADDVTVLHQGTLLFAGTPAELRADARVANAFLGMEEEPMESVK